jgi:hypothetical protein
MGLFNPDSVPLSPPTALVPPGELGQLFPIQDTGVIEPGITYRYSDKRIELTWDKDQHSTGNQPQKSLSYINAASISDLLEDYEGSLPNGRANKEIVAKIISNFIDPVCKKAFDADLLDIVSLSMRNERLRFELNEKSSIDQSELLRFHHWKMKPPQEQNDQVVESDIISLQKCYVLVRGHNVVIIDLSKEKYVGSALVKMIGAQKSSEDSQSSDTQFEHPLKVLRTLYGMVLRNQDATASAIEERLEKLNSRLSFDDLSEETLQSIRHSFSTHQGELSIAVGKLNEHKITVAQTMGRLIRILQDDSTVDAVWKSLAVRNMKDLYNLFTSQVVEADSDLRTLNQSIMSFNEFMTERQKNITQIQKMEQASRVEQVNVGLQHSNLAIAQTNLALQRAILLLAVPVTTASALQIGISVLPDNLQTIGTKLILTEISFAVAALLASFVYLKAARALNTQKTSIESIEAHLTD